MSKKRGKSGGGGGASAGPAKWESAIQQTSFNDQNWRGQIYFLTENRVEDLEHINDLATGVAAGTRRLFSIFSKEDLYNEVKDLGNPKNKKGKETPANYEICEPCKIHLDTDDEIPIHLLVKLLKWKFLTLKTNDQKRREAEKKAANEKLKGGAAGGKKDKKESKSAKSKGKKTPEPPSPKKESKLRKRGDEDSDSKFIDDEPDDGPDHYILVHGFYLPYVFQLLDEQGINVEATINIRSQAYSEPDEPKPALEGDDEAEPEPEIVDLEAKKEMKLKRSNLRKFWHDFGIVVENVPEDSNIHDLARLDYIVQSIILPDDPSDQEKKLEFAATLYEDIACLCYDLIDTKRQYKNYLENMKLLPIPPAAQQASLSSTETTTEVPTQEMEMRYYNDLMNTVPQESVSVELVMYCMLEQIDATENDKVPPSEMKTPLGADGVVEKVAAEINALIACLSLDENELEALAPEITVKLKAEEHITEPKMISPHDDIAMRVEHLKEMRGLNTKDAEQEMLRYIPFAGMNAFARPSSRTAKERSARLQELIHFCATTGLAQSEIDRALKQFVFECVDLTATDPNGFILTTEGEGAHHSLIPWDDPYPFFKGLLIEPESEAGSKSASGLQSSVSINSRDGAKSPSIESPNRKVQTPDERPQTPGILRTSSRVSQHSHSAVHFGTDHEGIEIMPLQTTPDPEKSIDQSMDEIVDAQKRNLDQWCFAEHYNSQVLLQVLRKAMYCLPYYDTYYHKRDHSLMIVLHNPQSPDKQNCNYWESNLHSGVGFRNYIEQVADSIDGWTRAEEAKYQAKVLRSEVDQIEEEIRSASRSDSTEKKRGRSKSPKKSGGRGRSTSRSESQDKPEPAIGENFVRADSLKMQKVEMDRIKAEEEEKERQKLEKRAKSAQKKASKEAQSADKDKRRPGSKGSKTGSRKSSPAAARDSAEPETREEEPKEPDPYWPFVGYDIGHDLIHASGNLSCMFPTDGGLIRTERIDFTLGTTMVRTTIVKDGHVFAIHVLDPKGEQDEEGEDGEVDIPEDCQDVKEDAKEDVKKRGKDDENEGKEKAELEENEKEVDEKDVEEIQDEEPKKSVSKYGSFSATLCDGLVLSYSSFGDTGKPDVEEEKVESLLALNTSSVRTPTPAAKEGKESPRKREKSTDKSSTPEPVIEEENEVKDPYRRPFQKLYLTSPDGLQVQLLAERDCGGSKGSDVLVVRQCYPLKTSGLQECESARLVPAMSEASRIITKEGNVVRTLADGRVEVQFADGTVSTMTGSPLPLPEPPAATPVRVVSASTKTREGSDSPTKRKARKGSSGLEKETPEEKKPEGLWQTTLPTGKRISTNMDGVTPVSVKDVLVCNAHDPETQEEMYSREDNVLIVHRPDGTTLVEHADGTRITRFMSETEVATDGDEEEDQKMVILERIVRVECPGFASIEFNEQSGHCDVRVGRTVVHAYPDASYIVDMGTDGERLSIDKEGSAAYFPKPNNDVVYNDANQELTYFMRHDHEVLFECLDNEGNMYTVLSSGDASVHPPNDDVCAESMTSEEDMDFKTPEHKIQLYKQHAPRFFLIHADGSGTELLRYQDIAEYLTQSEADPDTAVLIDGLADFPNVTGINILRPADLGLSQRWLKLYDEPTIIPNGLRSRDLKSLPPAEAKTEGVQFGTNLGQGLAIGSAVGAVPVVQGPKCPKVLEHRQLVQFRPVTDEVRDAMYDCLREYAIFVKDRNEESAAMQVHEPRNEEELMHAADLVLQSMPSRVEDLNANVVDVYERATAPPELSPPPTPQPKRTAADWERDRRELQEEENNREAMRAFDVPPYFQSEMGKSFLLSQAPDMDALLKELAQDPRQIREAAIRSQNATSASHYTNNNYVTGNTPSKLRPGAPTPAHATGECSPASVRPTAPTPAHADKMEDRPVNPTPKCESKSSNHHSIPQRISEEPEPSPQSPRTKSLQQDVVGEPRRKPVWIPAYLKASRPEIIPNTRFLGTEDGARRKVLTSSVAGATEKGKLLIQNSRGFDLLPSKVDFGTLREGYTYRFPVHLKNTGVDACRFKLEQPPPATGLSVQYLPGPVAAGMKAVLNVDIYAIAAGVEGDSGTGSIQHNLRIVTETHHLALPITAKVLTADDFDNRSPGKNTSPRAGVQLVASKSPGSHGIIRPRKLETVRN